MNTEHYFIVKYDPSTGWSWDTDLEAGSQLAHALMVMNGTN